MPIPMSINPGVIPAGFCPTNIQALSNKLAETWEVTFPLGLFNGSFGNTVPNADMQAFPWFRTNSDGTPDRWYVYANGSWVAPNPIPANWPCPQPYFGTYASIATLDGGEAGIVTADSGPMWQVIGTTTGGPTDYGSMGGFIPIGISADFGEGASGGSQQQTLALNQMPAHAHGPGLSSGTEFIYRGTGGGIGTVGGSGGSSPLTSVVGGNPDGSTAPINIMNPWKAVYWIARTGRIFYRA